MRYRWIMRRSLAAAISIALLAGCPTRESGIGGTVAGGAALGVGVVLLATDNTPECMEPHRCEWGMTRLVGGTGLIGLGAVLLIAGLAGVASHDWEQGQRPVASAPPAPGIAGVPAHAPPGLQQGAAPLVVDATKRDTEQDRLALQASYAARRGDCAGTHVAMRRLAAIDGSLHGKLVREDVPIEQCMR
jgi:hypothetical protein